MLHRLGESAPELRLCGAGRFIAPSAALIGRVILEARAGVRCNETLRGAAEPLYAGEETRVQDFAMLHADPGFPLEIAARVTIGRPAAAPGGAADAPLPRTSCQTAGLVDGRKDFTRESGGDLSALSAALKRAPARVAERLG